MGFWRSYEAAALQLVHKERTFEPDLEGRQSYDEGFAVYRELVVCSA